MRRKIENIAILAFITLALIFGNTFNKEIHNVTNKAVHSIATIIK